MLPLITLLELEELLLTILLEELLLLIDDEELLEGTELLTELLEELTQKSVLNCDSCWLAVPTPPLPSFTVRVKV